MQNKNWLNMFIMHIDKIHNAYKITNYQRGDNLYPLYLNKI